ncbi:peptidase inhibitor family I36 protein (plasmid) [Streptomyces sp. BB1-1-1]|uniref:peptidase inhibitor family I36 protein n=1 Tax=Streptomyces sp. BB1-1-1 TaxID=3074430 RepID=UPI0028772F74|nr:peptidase inhibitor family I36 protein [Streptomyces sp. BB1-1-1]WND32847.1 peptidase inhibitor family I36 protein [Streptomyces sp. BB1-1-1]WND40085.1 peptidase inhibitor family I36 protein [Streptomyces sp. BB1-1-1]WND40919.1 peptidase inhibitor family I36 protein [Streptomyces sp. BB1-1-1]
MFSSSTGNGARLARTLVGSTTLAGLLWAAPGLAHASAEEDPGTACPFNRTLCLFEGADYSGERFTVQSLDPSASVCVDLVEHGWGNRARSAVNTAARTAALFPNPDCTGRAVGVTDATPSLPFQPQSVQVY